MITRMSFLFKAAVSTCIHFVVSLGLFFVIISDNYHGVELQACFCWPSQVGKLELLVFIITFFNGTIVLKKTH